ncbi:MAG: helix-hairpin-helix domain-containing protein [Gammaproteobacteria bacterium]|nr:helix-hairpin-helix domain-containing protein [Gammaproteobacteria bacterium]MCP5135965.1 helix-hairpin-helix domain-containing protein [Gammaproteobacteria bacterium]
MKFPRIIAALCGMLLAFSAFAAPVNINTADKSSLAALIGIGEAKAEAIIKYREVVGPFKSVDEVVNVKGIGEKLLAKLRDQITVGETY